MAKNQEIVLRNGEKITLNEREILFCNYYLGECNKNGTQAAIKAGYSPRSATSTAPEILGKPNVQLYLKDKTAPILEALGITQEKVAKRLRDIAFTDLSDLTDDDWNLLPKSQIKKEHLSAIGAVEVDERVLIQEGEAGQVINRKTKFKLKEQQKALLALAEMTGLIDRKGNTLVQPVQVNVFNQVNSHIQEK